MQTSPDLVYLHGLNSSERSAKAVCCGTFIQQQQPDVRYRVPRLNFDPRLNEQQITDLLNGYGKPVGLLGSSMGGYYAAWASQRFAIPAVLINPVAEPHRLLPQFFGNQINPHTEERYQFSQKDVDYLSEQRLQIIHPELLQVWLETGDEVLDYRLAEHFFQGCDLRVLPGGDHSFVNFEQTLPEMLGFLLSKCSLPEC